MNVPFFHFLQTLEAEFFRQKEEQREFYCQTSSSDDVYVTGDSGGGDATTGVQNGSPNMVDGAGIY